MLEAPRELVHDQAFNVGRDEDNVQIGEIAEHGRATRCPARRVTLAAGAGPDLRNYRVDFAKLARHLPRPPAAAGPCGRASRSWSPPTPSTA